MGLVEFKEMEVLLASVATLGVGERVSDPAKKPTGQLVPSSGTSAGQAPVELVVLPPPSPSRGKSDDRAEQAVTTSARPAASHEK